MEKEPSEHVSGRFAPFSKTRLAQSLRASLEAPFPRCLYFTALRPYTPAHCRFNLLQDPHLSGETWIHHQGRTPMN